MHILVINGPNLNLLGLREPELYGRATYGDLVALLEAEAERLGVRLEIVQSNHEGELIDAIQGACNRVDGIIINPGAYTHTSIALLDALKAVALPAVEVHLTDPDKREEFRRLSYIRPACIGTIKGRGPQGYLDALHLLAGRLSR
ncbi:MAG: type II 3-dehydroquinate dehydratase [Firmicutes bacterium]|jgi:3-dehydroquinate dehydratase type II|nr:type II 3-dehydroquinate dehydratase [Bacillota bacterium]